ncbi:MAG: YihY family inner membrane protein [Candidatus Cloacimonetes bacterium]|nr:YihY family inner membrane protein [Candidatus Cloacimonadota bacterium]
MKHKAIQFLKIFWKKINDDGILKECAALTYVTILGFLPFIIFILFFLPELSFLQLNDKITEMIKNIFVPESAEVIYNYIQQLVSKKIPFNLFSFFILLISSYSLFQIINTAFDKILNAHEFRSKNFFSNIVKFFGMTILGSLMIFVLLSAISLPFLSTFFDIPFLQGILLYFTPVLILFLIFTFGFFYIPTVKVRLRSIIIGAATSSITWIIFKSLFNWYIVHLTNIEIIWGMLASIPIFLFWIYSNWVIMLSGITLVSISENRHIRPTKETIGTKLKITIEKAVDENEYKQISSATILNKDDVKDLLTNILLDGLRNSDIDQAKIKAELEK